ncbi:unnamed protein product [Brassica oleracea var. botrytis]|uniref:Uncharacterized protein n=1 Tax=Brassica oleracea TaxID=3712 RepID=A0A3P6BU89_BRAOL|nr:unnamed protein product [Brassica oleracea]
MEHWGPFYPPQQVVDFIKTKIIIDNVKFYDVNHDIFRALARTGIDSHHYGMVPKVTFQRWPTLTMLINGSLPMPAISPTY